MTSHGVARAIRPRTEEQRQIDLGKIQRYRDLEDDIRRKIEQKDYGNDTFQLSSKLLRLNPEYYTVWNVRRRCLISGLLSAPSAGSLPSRVSPSSSVTATRTQSSEGSSLPSSTETQQPLDSQTTGKSGTIAEEPWQNDLETIKAELEFTVPLLMQFPKCYWIWNYRLWVLNEANKRLPTAAARKIWQKELGLIGKMLDKDRRNFHAWGYRRFVVDQLEDPQLDGKSMVESEFEYATKMVYGDLSNFSAWHSRSQLIPRLLSERGANDEARREFLEKELSLVGEALNVGPEDQSLWFYHQYLVFNLIDTPGSHTIAPALTDEERKGYVQSEIDDIKDLLEDYQDIKWIYEALIGYTTSITRRSGETSEVLNQEELKSWLLKLRELDPGRKGRWTDLERKLALV